MATQLGSMAVGSIVKLNVDGVPANFIVVQQGNPDPELYDESCGGTWLLMEDCYNLQPWAVNGLNDYANSHINSWLNNSFLQLLDSNIQASVLQVRIPYRPNYGSHESVNSGANGLLVKVFLLSAYEAGFTTDIKIDGSRGTFPVDGAKIHYFLIGSDALANQKRIAKFNGSSKYWFFRSPFLYDMDGSGVRELVGIAGTSGEFDTARVEGTETPGEYKFGVRPAFILPPSLFVNDDGFAATNLSPETPASITVPELVKGGGELLVSWAAASDPDGDPVSYELERKTDAADWAQIYKGDQLSFTDQITKGWLSVQYRVRAVDSGNLSSGWTESETRTVDNNTAPSIACEHPDGTDLGEKAEPFAVNYTVTDPDGDPLTVTETVDGQTTRTETEAESGAAFEAAALNDPAEFQKLLNGPHTLTITATDGKAQTTHTLTFTKKVTSASVTLSEPLAVEGDITLAALRVAGSIPDDALFTVEVTNNGNDDQPVWQDATAEVKRGANIGFTNHTAAKGAAFNFRLSVSRGPSGEGGYITAITGAFQ